MVAASRDSETDRPRRFWSLFVFSPSADAFSRDDEDDGDEGVLCFKLQRNALSVLEHPTGNEVDDDNNFDTSNGSDIEAAKEVMKTHEINFVERPHLLAATIQFYNRKDIAFAPYGEYWRQVRKISILELLSAKRVRSFKSIREEEVSNFITSIYSKEGSPINLSRMIFSLGNGITARTSIGKKYKNLEAFLPIVEELTKALGGFNMIDIFPSPKFLYMVSRVRSRLERMHREVDEILDITISERRANSALASKMGKNEEKYFITSIYPEMFSGGGYTSSTALEWVMSELMKNPRVMKKAEKEVRQVFNDLGTIPDETSLHDLKFLKLIIKETLRLHPPVPLIPRECRKRCDVNGYDIHVKSKVLINAWAIGRDPNCWNEPERFYPERFINVSTLNSSHLMLFHFDWKPVDGLKPENLDMTESFGGAPKRKRDLKLIPISYRSLVG
ncbi:cytochrome P450 726A27-like [Populus nigra]|uniref:cytochrome P450 726A27-like n=1 Tax=Populus nigra TaxID=3691 RepID=UPI002B26BF55|nr:cytochrome P450 726A27-like [Populus nigra]